MPFSITHIPSDDKLAERLSWPLLEQFYPRERLEALIEACVGKTTHVRKLSLVLVIYVGIASGFPSPSSSSRNMPRSS
jgi:hypothetical protein